MTRITTLIIAILMAVPMFATAQTAITTPDGRVGVDARLGQTVLPRSTSSQVYMDIELRPQEIVSTSRVPLNVALVIDKSGSMSSAGKIDYAREAAKSIIDQLETYDRVSIVTFDSNVQVLMNSTTVTDPARIKRVIDGIRTGSNTALHGGMTTGAAQVRSYYNAEFLNRVIVLSDGKANVGPSSNSELAQAARSLGNEGISVTAMGLGLDYNEDSMTAIADASGGNYYFIESADQMAYQFSQEINGMMRVCALQTTLTFTTAPGVRVEQVYGYDVSHSGNKAVVRVGDLLGGRTVRVTALLTANTTTADRMGVASVDVDFIDAIDGRRTNVERVLMADLSDAVAEQEKSKDMTLGARVQDVRNAEATAKAMEAFASGDDNRAREIVVAAQAETRSFNAGAGMAADASMEEEMEELMMDMDEAAAAPAPAAARKSVVKSKKAEARSSSRGE